MEKGRRAEGHFREAEEMLGGVWIARICQTSLHSDMPCQAATLVPGYRQVESFGPDEDYLDEEEEVSYVTLDLGLVEPTLLPSTSTYRLIVSTGLLIHGADGGKRNERAWIHQHRSCSFLARYSRAVMTHFSAQNSYSRKRSVRVSDSILYISLTQCLDDMPNKRSLVHVGSTEQRIRFKEVQLKEKTQPERKEADLLEEVASMYVDAETDKIDSQAASSGQLEQPRDQDATEPPRKRKKKSRKGKERAVDVNDEGTMDTT